MMHPLRHVLDVLCQYAVPAAADGHERGEAVGGVQAESPGPVAAHAEACDVDAGRVGAEEGEELVEEGGEGVGVPAVAVVWVGMSTKTSL